MADDEKGSEAGFRVADKRRFDSSGNEKDDQMLASVGQERPAVTAEPARATETPAPEGGGHQAGYPELTFSSFILSLAQQALIHLGEVQLPPGMDMPRDPEAARQIIDILSLLEVKTKGNLDPEEGQFLEEILHNLRLSFVKVTK